MLPDAQMAMRWLRKPCKVPCLFGSYVENTCTGGDYSAQSAAQEQRTGCLSPCKTGPRSVTHHYKGCGHCVRQHARARQHGAHTSALEKLHYLDRAGWLRAAVLGANDGIVSVSSLIVGVAAADPSPTAVLVAGAAELAAGAMSMAAG
jgi:hypothetical protein